MEKLKVEDSSSSSQLEHHVINCRIIGPLDVYVQARVFYLVAAEMNDSMTGFNPALAPPPGGACKT